MVLWAVTVLLVPVAAERYMCVQTERRQEKERRNNNGRRENEIFYILGVLVRAAVETGPTSEMLMSVGPEGRCACVRHGKRQKVKQSH